MFKTTWARLIRLAIHIPRGSPTSRLMVSGCRTERKMLAGCLPESFLVLQIIKVGALQQIHFFGAYLYKNDSNTILDDNSDAYSCLRVQILTAREG